MAPKAKKVTLESKPVVVTSDSEVESKVNEDLNNQKDQKTKTKTKQNKETAVKKVKKSETNDVDVEDSVETKKRVVNGCTSSELVKQIHASLENEDISQKTIKLVCDTFIKNIIENVKNNDKPVTLTNYLTFKKVKRNERTHRVPKKKTDTDNSVQMITKPAHYILSVEVKPFVKKQFEELAIEQ